MVEQSILSWFYRSYYPGFTDEGLDFLSLQRKQKSQHHKYLKSPIGPYGVFELK